MLDNNGFPFAESSGSSGRYPKQWDLPRWKKVLSRPDVDWVEFRMCAFGLGPPDEENAYYQHLTRVVFRRNAAIRAILSRRCPGVSPSHRHVGLKGSRPGSRVTRCTEAGVYCPQFVQAIVNAVRAHVVVGGVGLFTLERPLPSDQDKAGGKEVENMENKSEEEEGHLCDGGEDEDVGDVKSQVSEGYSPSIGDDAEQPEAEQTKVQGQQGGEACLDGEIQLPRVGQPVDIEHLDEMGGAWALLQPVPRSYQPVHVVLEPSASMVATDGDEKKRLEEVPTPQAAEDRRAWHEFNDVNEFDEVIEAYIYGTEDDPNRARLDMTFGLDHADTYGPRVFLPDGRDFFQVGEGHPCGDACGTTQNLFRSLPMVRA